MTTKAPAGPPRRARASSPGAGSPRERARITVDPRDRRRVVLWVLAVVTVLAVGGVAATYSPWLAVDEVDVVGAPPDRVDEVRRAAGIDVGEPILTFLPGSRAGRVRGLPWVQDASVARELPGTVRIEVASRVPVGWVAAGKGVLVVDATGQVLWRVPGPPPAVPELVGVAEFARPGGRIGPPVLARVAGALGPDLRSRSATVTLADGAVTVRLADGPEVRLGAPRSVPIKVRVASAVLAAVSEPVAYVDVTVPAAPVSGG